MRLQRAGSGRYIHQPLAALPQVLPHRVAAAAQLATDALGTPAQRLKRKHPLYLLRRQHRLAPSACLDLWSLEHLFHWTSFVLEGGQFSMSPGVSFSCRLTRLISPRVAALIDPDRAIDWSAARTRSMPVP
jgi:hypothetical protein